MLENTFYSINSSTINDDSAEFSITLNKDHAIFDGHFPNNPITPGVVQMEIVKELTGKIVNKKVDMISMANCKFLAIINPVETPDLLVTLTLNEVEDGYKVSAQIKTESQIFLKISSVYH